MSANRLAANCQIDCDQRRLTQQAIGQEIKVLVKSMLALADNYQLFERHCDRFTSRLRDVCYWSLEEFVYHVLQFLPPYFLSHPEQSQRLVE